MHGNVLVPVVYPAHFLLKVQKFFQNNFMFFSSWHNGSKPKVQIRDFVFKYFADFVLESLNFVTYVTTQQHIKYPIALANVICTASLTQGTKAAYSSHPRNRIKEH